MFNDYVWSLYLDSGGREVVNFFEENLSNDFSKGYADKICEFHRTYCPSKVVNESLRRELVDAYEDVVDGICFFEEGEYTIESATKYIFKGFLNEEGATPQKVFNFFSGSVAFFTTLFSRELPELFIPYYFTLNFNVLEKIAQEFEMILPEMPVKKDYEGRFLYYGKICEALYNFREKHNMSPYELCAFLYDFAPKYVGGTDCYIIKDIPSPKSAYFIGGTRDDAFLSDDENIITSWQCSPDTMAGDAVVMYLKSPISAVDSVWRSVSIGFNDPFFYYYRCAYIAKPCKINRISQKQLEQDSVFGKMPIVKKNMQGINGVELYPSVYNHLLDMAESDLPRFEVLISDDYTLAREKDVEDKLIKPFLSELGYTEKDYKQQVYIEIGNHNYALIPDFVINPIVSKGHQFGDFIIEAKYSVPSNKILEEVKSQVRGYAKQFGAKYSVIASKEGIWITSIADDYTESVISFTWAELKNEDNFYKVFNMLGKGKLSRA